jgi:hypothetical protein
MPMRKQQKYKKISITALRETISPEFNLIKTSDTMGGALTHLDSFFIKIRSLPTVNQIIALAEAELAIEDRIAFENLEKSVAWFHEKIRILLPYVKWAPDSQPMADVLSLLNFHTISLSATGYLGNLLFELRDLFIEVAQEEKNYALFDGWTKCENGKGPLVFDWPEYVTKSLNMIPIEQQVSQWKEKADTSLPCLLRFLKILTLYPTFVPLVLLARPPRDSLSKNLRELEERQYQGYIGNYLNLFKSLDTEKHPLSNAQLLKLVDRFLCMLEQRIESHTEDDLGSNKIKINITMNQFLFFHENTQQENQKEEMSDLSQEPENAENYQRKHWRSNQCEQDIAALKTQAIQLWKEEISKSPHPKKLGRKILAQKLLDKLPAHISLHSKGKNRLPRALKAIKNTDPRIFDDRGNYSGLKPHWNKFEWVRI